MSKSRLPIHTKPRQAVMYVAKNAGLHAGLVAEFLDRERSTVSHGVRNAAILIDYFDDFRKLVLHLEEVPYEHS